MPELGSPFTICTISGRSGVGKTTLQSWLLGQYSDVHRFVSATTRAKRPNETGDEYRFVSAEEFAQAQRDDAFVWVCENHGHLYGGTKEAVELAFSQKGLTLIDISPEAVIKLYAYLQTPRRYEICPFYLHLTNEEEVRRRLIESGRDATDAEIERRVADCRPWYQMVKAAQDDHVVPFHIIDASLSFDGKETDDGSVLWRVLQYLRP